MLDLRSDSDSGNSQLPYAQPRAAVRSRGCVHSHRDTGFLACGSPIGSVTDCDGAIKTALNVLAANIGKLVLLATCKEAATALSVQASLRLLRFCVILSFLLRTTGTRTSSSSSASSAQAAATTPRPT